MYPAIQECQVVAVNPKLRRLTVVTPSLQMVEVRAGYHGPADGVRVSHKALPGLGSWGLVAFPYGFNINGVWLCGTYPGFLDANTTDTDPFMEYDAHWSGAYELMDQTGQWLKSFPDGTFVQLATSTAKMPTYRHIVDENQNQQLELFKDSDRIPNPPSPRYLYINHASGTTAEVDPSGNTTVNGAKSATCTVQFNKSTVVIDGSGNITVTGASGAQIKLTANAAYVTIDKNGGIEANAAAGQNLKVSSGGAAASYTLVRTDLFLAAFNGHVHGNGHGGANTTAPVTALTAGNVQSTMTDVSE